MSKVANDTKHSARRALKSTVSIMNDNWPAKKIALLPRWVSSRRTDYLMAFRPAATAVVIALYLQNARSTPRLISNTILFWSWGKRRKKELRSQSDQCLSQAVRRLSTGVKYRNRNTCGACEWLYKGDVLASLCNFILTTHPPNTNIWGKKPEGAEKYRAFPLIYEGDFLIGYPLSRISETS